MTCEDYRRIAFLSTMYKVLSIANYRRLMRYAERVIINCQWGFYYIGDEQTATFFKFLYRFKTGMGKGACSYWVSRRSIKVSEIVGNHNEED